MKAESARSANFAILWSKRYVRESAIPAQNGTKQENALSVIAVSIWMIRDNVWLLLLISPYKLFKEQLKLKIVL